MLEVASSDKTRKHIDDVRLSEKAAVTGSPEQGLGVVFLCLQCRCESRIMAKKKTAKKKVPNRRRRPIPGRLEAELLTKCNYRCCVCYQLNGDIEEKRGQIAHIDHNPANNSESNLVFLCLDHHAQYDSTSRQSKGLTEGYVRQAYERLQEYFRMVRKERIRIEITLDRDFDSFNEYERSELLADLCRVAASTGIIREINVKPGSVKVELEVTGEFLANLLRATVGRGLLILKRSLDSWPVERPRDLLSAFAEKFCEPIEFYGGKKIVFDRQFFTRSLGEFGRAMGIKPPLASITYWIEPVIGGGVIHVPVFCMFGEEYVKALIANGIKIDLDKWKTRKRDWS